MSIFKLTLLILIIIYGLVIGLFCLNPFLFSFLNNSPSKIAEVQIKNFATSLSYMKQDIGRYPSSIEGLSSLVICPISINEKLWKGPYMSRIPNDPWENKYVYRLDLKTNLPRIYSTGSDRQTTTMGNDRDDVNNWDLDRKWLEHYYPNRYQERLKCFLFLAIIAVMIYFLIQNKHTAMKKT